MTINELLRKYKHKYRMSVLDQGNTTSMALMYIGGNPSREEKDFYSHLLNLGVAKFYDFIPSQERAPILTDGNARMERMFLMFLLSKNEIVEDQIDKFRKRMFQYHKNHLPWSIIKLVFYIITAVFLIGVTLAYYIFN